MVGGGSCLGGPYMGSHDFGSNKWWVGGPILAVLISDPMILVPYSVLLVLEAPLLL